MGKKSQLSLLLDWIRQKTPPSHTALIILFGIFFAYLLRNPLTPLLTGGKTFTGRSVPYQIIFMAVYSLFFITLILTIYLQYFRVKWFNKFISRIIRPIKKSRKIQSALLFLMLVSIFYSIWWNFTPMEDTAYFGGDTWEYQSMGVNFAYGHGVQKFGGLESYKTYKFAKLDTIPTYYDDFFRKAGQDIFRRQPAYPLFLGIVYKIFGVSPFTAKAIQLLMLVIIAAYLPLIGFHYWGKNGLVGGIPAGVLYLAITHQLSSQIMTETLVSFVVFLVLLALMNYEQRPGTLSSIFLGSSLGFVLLVKDILYLIPILTGLWIIIRYFINHDKKEIMRLLIIILSTVIIILPWTSYVSYKSGHLVLISTKGSSQLLDDNNELCIDGRWHPEWKENENSFYNTDGIDQEYAIIKVVNFYWHNPNLFPRCMVNKFLKGFGPSIGLWIFIGLVLIRNLIRMVNRWTKSQNIQLFIEKSRMKIPAPFWVIGGNFLLITLIFHGEKSIAVSTSRFIAPMDFIFELLCCVLFVLYIKPLLDHLFQTNTSD
ncbi:MAG: hypothetical protein LLG42_14955 [Chloroflexi bacterium]|nr:hypothetical protein [Chloroflexota bacterium]